MSDLFHGRYIIQGEIGKGRVSTVYRATDTFTDDTIALKIFSPQDVPGYRSLLYLDLELEKRLTLAHPNIVQILDKGRHEEEGGLPTIFLSLEYIEGCTLAERISKLQQRPYTLEQILLLLLQVVDALDYLHSQEIPITNLEPRRILLENDDTLKLPAFGFATSAQWQHHGSRLSRASGLDYRYIAPEMIQEFGITTGDARTDIYLFGILAFELGCATAPYDANRQTLLQLHKTEPVPDTLLSSALPAWYNQFVQRCMEKDSEKRISLSELRELFHDKLSNHKSELTIVPNYIGQTGMQVLFVEDNRLDQLSLARFAKRERYPFAYKIAQSVSKAKQLLETKNFDVIVSDFMLPDGTAVDVMREAPHIPTLVITGAGKEEVAAMALKAGAYDYIPKDMKHQYLMDIPHLVMRAFEYSQTVKERDLFAARIRELEQSDIGLIQHEILDKMYDCLSMSFAHIEGARKNIGDQAQLITSLDHLEAVWKHTQSFIHQALAKYPVAALTSEDIGNYENIPFEEISSSQLHHAHLLLLENDAELRSALERTLAQQGCTITLLESLEAVISTLTSQPPKESCFLIVNDDLPYLNRLLSHIDKKSKLPIIQYCSYLENLPANCFRRKKQFYYLQKPIIADRILRVIEYCQQREGR